MDKLHELGQHYISETYLRQGINNIQYKQQIIEQLLHHGRLLPQSLSDDCIEFILQQFATMDSNNFHSNCGVGEREGRVISSLVSKRHYHLSHGIGRSGDISEVQPKAAGSSIIYKLTNRLTFHALQLSGLTNIKTCLVLPLATGMTLTLCLMSLRSSKPNAKYVIFSRIDQKSCFKSIIAAGFIPLIINMKINEDNQMITDIDAIRDMIISYGIENILAVLSTTSCFAPRQPDDIPDIAKICKEYDINHIINNAYGLQSPIIAKLINRGMVIGKVDLIIQSTDKNFLVPVGGAIVTSGNEILIKTLSASYPGRANASPIVDLFITLLSLGEQGYKQLLKERIENFQFLSNGLSDFVSNIQGTILPSPKNDISIAINLSCMNPTNATMLGSMLFHRSISGCRVIPINHKVSNISGFEFQNWGSHIDNYHLVPAYFTIAAAIGVTRGEIVLFLDRLERTTKQFMKKYNTSLQEKPSA